MSLGIKVLKKAKVNFSQAVAERRAHLIVLESFLRL